MTETTIIRNAAWAAVWNAVCGRHEYQQGIDIALRGDRIVHVGRGYAGPCDRAIDGSGLFVMPGLVNVHAHTASEPAGKGFREEHGVPAMYMTGLYERLAAFRLDADGQQAACEYAYCELLKSGVTSVVDLNSAFGGWLDLAARSGLRVWLGPFYASAGWVISNRHSVGYDWDEAGGQRDFDSALSLIEAARSHPCGRLDGVLSPGQIDTCSRELLQASVQAAADRDLIVTTHASQSVLEFQEMVRRHGKTPIQWAAEIGLLGPRTLLGHAIFIDEHSWIRWHSRTDLDLLADSGTSIAHCPLPFARYGAALEDLGRYRRRGVNVGLGTDTLPLNMLEEMRAALMVSHLAARDVHATGTGDVFHAATVSGAQALGRDDIGRLCAGAKADLVLVDATHPAMQPLHDPLRSLVYVAADRAVRDVFVDGRQVLADGRVLTLDQADAGRRLAQAQQRALAGVPRHDHAHRSAEEMSPRSLVLAEPH
jgi:cytosine/adenosine deaminase-related metal-dependent hydrolase